MRPRSFPGDPKSHRASRAHHSGSAESFLRAIIRPKRKADGWRFHVAPQRSPWNCALRCKGVRECSGKYRPFRDRLAKMFAAVIEGASQGELAVTTDQHCALQMTEIEQEESFLLVDVRIGNFERVKRTNLRQLH